MSNLIPVSEFDGLDEHVPIRPEKIWVLLLNQKRTFSFQTLLLECLLGIKRISPVLRIIEGAIELKLRELSHGDPNTRDPYIFYMDFAFWFGNEKNLPSNELLFTPLQAVVHLQTVLSRCIGKTVPLEPYTEILKTIMGFITTLQNVVEKSKIYNEEDEVFCIKAIPLMLRIAVILHPGRLNGDQFLRDFLHWICKTFLSYTAKDEAEEKFRNRLGLKICKSTLSIFSNIKIFNILTSRANDYIQFIKELIKSKFGPEILAFCPIVLSSLFVRCQMPSGGVHFRMENYWLAMNATFYIIRTIVKGDLIERMSLRDTSSFIGTFPLIFESNAHVKVDGKSVFFNKCLMRYLTSALISEVIYSAPEVSQSPTMSISLGCHLLILAATQSLPLLQLFVGAMHYQIKRAASQANLKNILAACLIIQEVFKENTDMLLHELSHIDELLYSILIHYSEMARAAEES